MTQRAWVAIVEMRLRYELRSAAYACVAAAIVGLIQPRGLAGPVFFCSLLGIVIALIQGPGRFVHLDLSELTAPLYGRELARAKALVPCIVAATAVFACVFAAEAAGSRDLLPTLTATLSAVIPATLTALSATIRTGSSRRLYIVLACVVSAGAFAIVMLMHAVYWEMLFAVIVSFLALRQYGEALARYDPV